MLELGLLIFGLLTCANSQDHDMCSSPLGLSDEAAEGITLTSNVDESSTPEMGRLNNPNGAWCFTNNSVASETATFEVAFEKTVFVSGFATQGPPTSLFEESYTHDLWVGVYHSLDGRTWFAINSGDLFFTQVSNRSFDDIFYHLSNTAELTKHVRFVVSRISGGGPKLCLRFEVYGCTTEVVPQTYLEGLTTKLGELQVIWQVPKVRVKLGQEDYYVPFSPSKYKIAYQTDSKENGTGETVSREYYIKNIHLDTEYNVKLRCVISDAMIDCRSMILRAFPPCSDEWFAQQSHCYLLTSPADFESTYKTCTDNSRQPTPLGRANDAAEQKQVTVNLLGDELNFWLVDLTCNSTSSAECCQKVDVQADGKWTRKSCENRDDVLQGICVRENTGKGAVLQATGIEALDSQTVLLNWKYTGKGWRTSQITAKLWKESSDDVKELELSSQDERIKIGNLEPEVIYSLILKPRFNIITREIITNFTIIDFGGTKGEGGDAQFGALLCFVPIESYLFWNGTIRTVWDEAKANSAAPEATYWIAEAYVITYYVTSGDNFTERSDEIKSIDYFLTPVSMETEYNFRLECKFGSKLFPCGRTKLTTGLPNKVQEIDGIYSIYQLIEEPLKWQEAENECEKLNGHLFSVNGEKEFKEIIKFIPKSKAHYWIGAKLSRTNRGQWTDGSRIGYFPVSNRVTGVTSTGDSCFRTSLEGGRTIIVGESCDDMLSFVCEFKEQELIKPLIELKVETVTNSSISVSWNDPSDLWRPTHYDVYICLDKSCDKRGSEVVDYRQSFTNLREFTDYTIKVDSVLKPLKLRSTFSTEIMTEPTNPIKYAISTDGSVAISSQLLVSRRRAAETMEVTLKEVPGGEINSSGNTKNVTLSGLVPGREYRAEVRASGDSKEEWKYSFNFLGYPTCLWSQFQLGNSCYWILENSGDEPCQGQSGYLATPSKREEIEAILDYFFEGFPTTFDSTKLIAGEVTEDECVKDSRTVCCAWVDDKMTCSCCQEEYRIMCQSDIKVNLGKIEKEEIKSLSFDSLELKWEPPQVLWRIPQYKIEWKPVIEIGRKRDRGEALVESTEFSIGKLRSEASYIINITPLSDRDLKGNDVTVTLTTLKDPRIPALWTISADGLLSITSPKLKDMGRGKEILNVTIFETARPSIVVAARKSPADEITTIGLVPTVNYTIIEKSVDDTLEDAWYHSFTFLAYPTCAEGQFQIQEKCLWPVRELNSRAMADEACLAKKGTLFTPINKSQLEDMKAYLMPIANTTYWINISSNTFEKAEIVYKKCQGDETFDPGDGIEASCCSYNVVSQVIACSCCSEKKMATCQKPVKMDLGKVEDYKVTQVTCDSATVEWNPPKRLWNVRLYNMSWVPEKQTKRKKDRGYTIVSDIKAKIEKLKEQRAYLLSVTPYAADNFLGESYVQKVTTLKDTRPPLQYEITEDGKMTVTSPKLVDMGRSGDDVDVTIYEVDENGKEIPVKEAKGPAGKTTLTGLTPGKNYTVKITVPDDEEEDTVNHTAPFVALPTCKPGQIQSKLDCYWLPNGTKSWKEATQLCRQNGGKLVEPEATRRPSMKSALVSTSRSDIWVDVSGSVSIKGDKLKSTCQNVKEDDPLCCSYDVNTEATEENLNCICCDEEKPFACKSSKTLDLGQVRNLRALDKTEDAVTIRWDPPNKAWGKLSYLLTWSGGLRSARGANEIVVNIETSVISNLRPKTTYVISVAPYAAGVIAGENTKVDVTTSPLNLGEVKELKVGNVTENSLSLSWKPPPRTWDDLAYLITWSDSGNRRTRRATQGKLVTDNGITVTSLKPKTTYTVGVTPYADNGTAGGTKEIVVTTSSPPETVFKAGLFEYYDSGDWYPLMLARIICCTWITFLVGTTLVIYVVFGMFFQDCLAQMCAELALIAAYTCILLADERIGDPTSELRLKLCAATAIFLQFFFQVVFLFMLLEVVIMCRLVSPFFPFNILTKPWSLLLFGWGVPSIITALSAIIIGRNYIKTTENCWLDLSGSAMAPTVIPICIFIVLQALLLVVVFLATDIQQSITAPHDKKRAQVFITSRWASACIFLLTVVAWATGIVGIDRRDSALTTAFVVVSFFLGILILVLRVASDELLRQRMATWFRNRNRHRNNKVNSWPAKIMDSNDVCENQERRQNSTLEVPLNISNQ